MLRNADHLVLSEFAVGVAGILPAILKTEQGDASPDGGVGVLTESDGDDFTGIHRLDGRSHACFFDHGVVDLCVCKYLFLQRYKLILKNTNFF
jgi:hypothetical protein